MGKKNKKTEEANLFRVKISVDHSALFQVSIYRNNKLSSSQSISHDKFGYLLFWMMKALRPVFLEFPCEVRFSQEIRQEASHPTHRVTDLAHLEVFLNELYRYTEDVVNNTKQLLAQYQDKKNCCRDYDGVWLHSADGNARSKGFFEFQRERFPVPAYYSTYNTGWDKEQRCFVHENSRYLSAHELVEFCLENRIGTMVSENFYLESNALLPHRIYLPAVWTFLGVRHVGIDIDPWDLLAQNEFGVFHTSAPNLLRFSPLGMNTDLTIQREKAENIQGFPLFQHYSQEKQARGVLEDDYSITVLTLSRLPNMKNNIMKILYLLQLMATDLLQEEIVEWYYSMQLYALNDPEMSAEKLTTFNRTQQTLATECMQFLKYEALHHLQSKRKIRLYGDSGWNTLFPEYYRGLLNAEEIQAVHKAGNTVYLTMNGILSYVECGGPVYDMLAQKVPFLVVKPWTRTANFQGLRHMEYGSWQEMNDKINNARVFWQKEELQNALDLWGDIFNQAEASMAEIIFKKPRNVAKNLYEKTLMAHIPEQQAKVAGYEEKNRAMLQMNYRKFAHGEWNKEQFDVQKSRYWSRPYFQRMWRHITGG
ncbi:MAG TPA: hypothetical protein VN611_08220 [Patescibacteria group bacterium]|nr:hypothetical protein [Patescibacteria group bacterium]